MLFNSYEFLLLFLPVTLTGFFVFGRYGRRSYAILWLVLASLFFYGWWNPRYLLLISFSILINYYVGLLITSARRSYAYRNANILVITGVTINLLIIGYFKYANFFIDTVNSVSGTDWNLARIILPIGISFFTFQQIAYLVDTRRGQTEEHNFLQYCLFVVFFPQLIAGPIVHHKEMLPQFGKKSVYRPFLENIAIGGTILAIGLFKKVAIADNLALVATPVFDAANAGNTIHFFQAWRGTFAYTLQLYFDFSGYSDMAIGLGRLFGIRLPLNFHSPYQATSIIDFWRRWHMTLSRFLRDYVYVGLGGNRRGRTRRHINIMITMLLGGLWHGANWTFVVWGGLHGFFLLINHGWRRIWKRPLNRWWSRLMARAITFMVVAMAWVFFRAESFDAAIRVFDGMRNLPNTLPDKIGMLAGYLQSLGFRFEGPMIESVHLQSVGWLLGWIAVLWLIPNTQQWMSRFEPAYNYMKGRKRPDQDAVVLKRFPDLHWRPVVSWGVYCALLFTIAILSMSQVSEFLYFQF